MDSACPENLPHHHPGVAGETWLCQIREQMRIDGHRLTSARSEVLSWISHRETPFTAELVVRAHAHRHGTGSRSTIYRLLQLLKDDHWLSRVTVNNHEHSYLRQLPGHDTAICLKCGSSLSIGGYELGSLIAPSLEGTGFAIHRQELAVYGLCFHCREGSTEL